MELLPAWCLPCALAPALVRLATIALVAAPAQLALSALQGDGALAALLVQCCAREASMDQVEPLMLLPACPAQPRLASSAALAAPTPEVLPALETPTALAALHSHPSALSAAFVLAEFSPSVQWGPLVHPLASAALPAAAPALWPSTGSALRAALLPSLACLVPAHPAPSALAMGLRPAPLQSTLGPPSQGQICPCAHLAAPGAARAQACVQALPCLWRTARASAASPLAAPP